MNINGEVCENCRKSLVPSEGKWDREWYSEIECDGILTLGPDPFAEEIHDDHSDYLMCDGERHESAMDI